MRNPARVPGAFLRRTDVEEIPELFAEFDWRTFARQDMAIGSSPGYRRMQRSRQSTWRR